MANKKRRCLSCREYFDAESGLILPAGFFCTHAHALEYARKKQEETQKKKHRQQKREFDENDRGKQLRDAQQAFNEFVRLRDKDQPCISCGKHHEGQYHAGHYRSVGAAPQLRFNQFNNNKQCAPCNVHKSGSLIEYRIGLVKKIGLERVEWLESQNEPLKLSLEEIKAIKVYYRDMVKRMKAEK